MLRNTANKKEEIETGRKFNVEGNQTTYYYPVEITAEEAYDRNNAKTVMKAAITKADDVSREIDTALINTAVNYEAPFNVNDSFDDAMETFLSKK
jgi:recombinational DNA repair protein RecT